MMNGHIQFDFQGILHVTSVSISIKLNKVNLPHRPNRKTERITNFCYFLKSRSMIQSVSYHHFDESYFPSLLHFHETNSSMSIPHQN